jgi:hypothetical protein
VGLCWSGIDYCYLGGHRTCVPFFGYLAARHQYRYDDRDLSDGLSYTKLKIRIARAINLKLNELIRAIDKARDQMIDIENLSDLELDELTR